MKEIATLFLVFGGGVILGYLSTLLDPSWKPFFWVLAAGWGWNVTNIVNWLGIE